MAHTQSGLRLSPQQRRSWLLGKQSPDVSLTAQAAIAISGPLAPSRLRSALSRLVTRHEILRTSFMRSRGMRFPLQYINDDPSVEWREEEAADAPGRWPEHRLGGRDFELNLMAAGEASSPVQATLVKGAEAEHTLFLSVSAMCADSASMKLIARDLARAYGDDQDDLHEVAQYADVAEVFNELLEVDELDSARQYWKRPEITDAQAVSLPFERKPKHSFRTALTRFDLGSRMSESLEALSCRLQVSLEAVLAACWHSLLCRFAREDSLVVAHSFDGRTHEDLQTAIGPIGRVLPLPAKFGSAEHIGDIACRVDEALRTASAFQEYFSSDQLHNADAQADDLGYCAVGFEYEQWPAAADAAGVRFSLIQIKAGGEPFKIKLRTLKRSDEILAELHFDSSRFDSEDVERLSGYLHALIGGVIERPKSPLVAIPLLEARERCHLAFELNTTAGKYPGEKCVHTLFEEQAKRTPEETAVVFEHHQLTYRDLNALASRFALELVNLGVQPEHRVAVFAERSVEMIVAILAILKAGAAFVPLDPLLPQKRLEFMLRDAGVKAVTTQIKLAERLNSQDLPTIYLDLETDLLTNDSFSALDVGVSPSNVAYVIYTSGSTGLPKGVAVEHRQLMNYITSIIERLSLPDKASYALVSTIAADLGHTVTFPSLCSGGTLHVISQETASTPTAMAEYFRRHQIDCLKISPSHLAALMDSSESVTSLPRQRLILGGESSSKALIERVRSLGARCRIFNHYGPTETTVGALTYSLEDGLPALEGATLPLGRPIANTHIYLLDAGLQLAPKGIPAEVFIGGGGVGRGYLGQPDMTAARFIPDPFGGAPGARLYRTGDLARYLPDGNIEFLGRLDHQVKIRGYRVETTEVEAALLEHRQINEAAVIARHEVGSDTCHLAAYFVPASRSGPSVSELRSHLKDRLPEYMVPSTFVSLASLPLTANGKLDRQALPDPAESESASARAYIAPRSEVEQTIASAWQEVLPVEKVGLYDNFFDLGGHSLSMIRIHSKLVERFGRDVPILDLFQHTTVSSLARYLSDAPAVSDSVKQTASRAESRRTAIGRRQNLRRAL